jgi:hypothetical protein
MAKQQVAKKEEKENLPAVLNYEQDAGRGMEGVDRDSLAIPFLITLQPLSPVIVDRKIEGAQAGMLLNSVTLSLYENPIIVPCAFQRRWVRWAAREVGGGFKGELTTAQANDLRQSGTVKELDGRLYYPEQDGSVNPKKSDRLADTRNHYCLVLQSPQDELPVAMVFALASTGIKVSKNLMSRIDSVKMKGADGRTFTPPSFSHMYSVKTTLKTNEKGRWYIPEIDTLGKVESPGLYASARAFNAQVMQGRVDLAHDSVRETEAATDDDRM